MTYFYGSKEQAKNIKVDAYASVAHKQPIGDATLVYTDDAEIAAGYKAIKVDVKPIGKVIEETKK